MYIFFINIYIFCVKYTLANTLYSVNSVKKFRSHYDIFVIHFPQNFGHHYVYVGVEWRISTLRFTSLPELGKEILNILIEVGNDPTTYHIFYRALVAR